MPTDSAASGRPALAATRDDDWEALVQATHSLPKKVKEWGLPTTLSWARTELKSLVGLVGLAAGRPRTADLAEAERNVRLYLTDGVLLVMVRNDDAGLSMRTEFLEAVEGVLLEPTLQAVFERSAPFMERPYKPTIGKVE